MTNFDIRFEIRKLQFYAVNRRNFWRNFARCAQVAGCVLSTAAAVTILSGHEIVAAVVSLVASTGCLLSMVWDADGSWRAFNALDGRLLDFERTLPDSAEADVQQADPATKDVFYRLKGEFPSFIPCLDAICDNAASISFGFPARLRLNWFESWVGRHWSAVHYTEKAPGPLRLPVPPKPARQ